MAQRHRSPIRRLLDLPLQIVVALYIVVDAIVAPLFGPVVRLLSSLRIVQRLERWIDALNPYVILVLLGVPFALAEAAKALGVFLMTEGHFHSGMTIFIGAYVVSIFVCERIFHAGKRRLMTIGWFAKLFNWVMSIRDAILGWFRETRVWRFGLELRQKARIGFRRLRVRTRSAFGMKPRGLFERQ